MMERLIWNSLRLSTRLVLWTSIAPFVTARQLYRWTGQLGGAWLLATQDAVPCSGCGSAVDLTGRWECGRCHFVFDGFAFSQCGVCGAVPPFITCQVCGVGFRSPLLP